MDIKISTSYLNVDDPDAALVFYRDVLGYDVRNDVGQGEMRWITVGPASQPDVSVVLGPAAPEAPPAERKLLADMMAKGMIGLMQFTTDDLDATFEKSRLQAPMSCRNPSISRGACATVPYATLQATCSASTRPEPCARPPCGPRDQSRFCASVRTLRRICSISSKWDWSAIRGGDSWMTGSPRSSARQ